MRRTRSTPPPISAITELYGKGVAFEEDGCSPIYVPGHVTIWLGREHLHLANARTPAALRQEVLQGGRFLDGTGEGVAGKVMGNQLQPGRRELSAGAGQTVDFPAENLHGFEGPTNVGEDQPGVGALDEVHFTAIGVIVELSGQGVAFEENEVLQFASQVTIRLGRERLHQAQVDQKDLLGMGQWGRI